MDNHTNLKADKYDAYLSEWREREKEALDLLVIVGELRFDRSIELVLFRKDIYDARPSEVLTDLRFSSHFAGEALTIETALELAKAIKGIENLSPAIIDLGTLGIEWNKSDKSSDISDFVRGKLGSNIGANVALKPKDIVLYGFGRIGRLAARRIIQQTGKGEQLRLKAIVIRPQMKDKKEEATKRAALLISDSVHGEFRGTVEVADDGNALIINGNHVALIYAKAPEEIDYREYGIEDGIVIDNTGVWRDKAGLSCHLRPGISKVILTAPAKDIPNIVYGVNHESVDHDNDVILSAASCTTNAIVPVIKVIHDQFGIEKGHIETIHAYTNDQNLLDNFHKGPRRGRSAAQNLVLTTTGAEAAITKVLPHLAGKFTGNSVRVPTPNVSLAILNLTVSKAVTMEEINEAVRNASYFGGFAEQIQFSTDTEYVSSNAVGTTTTSVFDAPSTIVSKDGKSITLYAWYDNEYGYTCQVIRFAKHVAQVRRFAFY
ncbi:MAG: glyceraldehyde-3-phosphate dehydrogenase [Saprospiraceae bacterium]